MVLSLVAAVLPTLITRESDLTEWVEDVGGFDASPLQYDRELLPALDGPADAPPSSPAPQPAAEEPAGKIVWYTVSPGDTLSKIAGRFKLTLETLVWANELADPNLVFAGSKLAIPPADGVLHRVRPGDTLAELANFYGASVERAIEVNGLEPPYVIVVGQRVLLPGGKMPIERPDLEDEESPRPAPAPDVQAPRDNGALAAAIVVPPPAPRPLPQPANATPQQAQFILMAAEAARESQKSTGVPASVTIAQAILESFWGSSRLSRENNNYFGIKARERPGSAGVAWYDVWEVINGQNVTRREPFRAYRTAADSFVDHGLFFQQNGRYARALAAKDDPKQFAREINSAGYATDPAYAPKLIGLMDRFNLYQYDLK